MVVGTGASVAESRYASVLTRGHSAVWGSPPEFPFEFRLQKDVLDVLYSEFYSVSDSDLVKAFSDVDVNFRHHTFRRRGGLTMTGALLLGGTASSRNPIRQHA